MVLIKILLSYDPHFTHLKMSRWATKSRAARVNGPHNYEYVSVTPANIINYIVDRKVS